MSSLGELDANGPMAPRLPAWPQLVAHGEIGRDVRPFALTRHASPVRRAAAHGPRRRASHAAPGPERRFLPSVAGRAVHTRPHLRCGSHPSRLCALPKLRGPRRRPAARGRGVLASSDRRDERRVVRCTRVLRRSHQARTWRLRSSRSVNEMPGQKLFLTTPTVRSILPFVWGVRDLQTRGATPMEAMKSAKRGFQRGPLSTLSKSTLFMRSVSAALGKPPKYSKASIKQRIMLGASQRLTNTAKRIRE